MQGSKSELAARGTGLGLAICKEIVLAHHGKIWSGRDSKNGAVFTFVLPITQ